jgi:hypothetical protein
LKVGKRGEVFNIGAPVVGYAVENALFVGVDRIAIILPLGGSLGVVWAGEGRQDPNPLTGAGVPTVKAPISRFHTPNPTLQYACFNRCLSQIRQNGWLAQR